MNLPSVEIGNGIKQIRIKKGLSLDVIHQHTKVPKKYLEAIESDNFKVFPAVVYLRGSLETYCAYLDLDFEEIWAKLTPPPPPPEPSKKNPLTEQVQFSFPKLQPSLVAPAALLSFIFILAVVIWTAGRLTSREKPSQGVPAASSAIPELPRAALLLTLEAEAPTWIRLKTDKALQFEGVLPARAQQNWKAEESIQLRAASYSSLKASLNGKPINLEILPIGANGEKWLTHQALSRP